MLLRILSKFVCFFTIFFTEFMNLLIMLTLIQSNNDCDIQTLPALFFSTTSFADCEMETIGKPVYHTDMSYKYGSWMKDSNVMDNSDTYWITTGHRNDSLLEFANKSTFIAKTPTNTYHLPFNFIVSSKKSMKSARIYKITLILHDEYRGMIMWCIIELFIIIPSPAVISKMEMQP